MAKGKWQPPELTCHSGVPSFVDGGSVVPLGPDTIMLELATEEVERAEISNYWHEHCERVEEIAAIARNQLGGE